MDIMRARRSIRRYSGEPVTGELVTTMLEAAMAAPSAGNEQPWEFIVITERGESWKPSTRFIPTPACCWKLQLRLPSAATQGARSTRACGYKIVPPPQKTFCLKRRIWAWGPCGWVSIPTRNASSASAIYWGCLRPSFRCRLLQWGIQQSTRLPRSALTLRAFTGITGNGVAAAP